jgi:ABC-type multidrug transport system permease subunit
MTSHPLVELTRVRIREFLREKEAVFWVFVFPVLLALALGIAFRSKPADLPRVGVVEGADATRVADALRAARAAEPRVVTETDASRALRTGAVDVLVHCETDAAGRPAYTYELDPTRPESRLARLAADDALQRAGGRTDAATATEVEVVQPGSRYIDWLIPGLIGMNLMGSGMWGLGFSIVTARMRKLLKRLAATPMRRSHYLASFMLSRLVFLLLEVVAVLGFAWLAFGVTVYGSLVAVFAISLLGSLTFAGIGLLVASRATTIEGVSGWMNLVMLPMWLLSGTFFSSSKFPDALQPAIKALPLTALNDALRAVINEGSSITACGLELGVLALWCVVSFALALRWFRWQ